MIGWDISPQSHGVIWKVLEWAHGPAARIQRAAVPAADCVRKGEASSRIRLRQPHLSAYEGWRAQRMQRCDC